MDFDFGIKKSLNKKLKSIILKKIETTSIHGVPQIVNTKYLFIKVIWLVFFTISCGVCAYYIINNVQQYLNYEITSKIEYLAEANVLFPAVEFCNANLYQTEGALNLIIDYLAENTNYSFSTMKNVSKMDFINQLLYDHKYLESSLKTYTNGLNSTQKKMLGFPIEKILLTCNFASNTCSAADFDWNFRKSYGNCYTFNLRRTFRSIGSGETYKLKLEIFAGLEEQFVNSNDQNHGLRILVYNQSNFYQIADYGINVAAGQAMTLTVQRVLSENMPKPYSSCDFTTTEDLYSNEFDLRIYNLFIAANRTYSQENCLRVCYRHLALTECKCFDDILKPFPEKTITVKYCKTEEELKCIDSLYEEIVLKRNPIYNCSYFCPLECVNAYFQFGSYYANFPKAAYANILFKNKSAALNALVGRPLTSNEFGRNLVQLNIYFEFLNYQYVSQDPTLTWMTLLSNVGGVLGLFIGMSLLSFVEIVEAFLEVILITIKQYTTKVNVLDDNNQNI